ncbi:spermine/spermidine synthase domain-containing protein [Phaeacidiphilus oryzae]|uniref:spermine/spermidine synthase domain-containing protein n=1 Tax=Phaeacidiphilus oryzae TaxID=348818 RepID=UPI000A048D47|nr:hypothetical protein [Phaeacidiphilus oryzae]
MINQHVTSGAQRRTRSCRPGPRAARTLVLLAAFVCAACGLVYELELVALASYLLGDSVTQASVVLSVMVFAMGLGSLLAKRFTGSPAISFATLECCLALTGGLSVLALYGSFVWIGHWYRAVLVGFALLIGVLMGAEIPLLVSLIERFRRSDGTEPGRTVADLFAADYVGALVGGLAFPFLLLPLLGEAAGALLTGAVNAMAGAAVVLWLDPERLPPRMRAALWAGCGAVLALLGLAAAGTGAFEEHARQALYGAPVRAAEQSRYQQIVLTGPQPRLYLGGTLVACRRKLATEARYARLARPFGTVLVVGGGDGILVGDLLRQPAVRRVVVVERDPDLLRLARRDPGLSALNGHALADPRVRAISADAFAWLRGLPGAGGWREPGIAPAGFDTVLVDPAEPTSDDDRRKLGSEEFYGLLARGLRPGGRLAVRTGVDGLWSAAATLAAVGESARAYRLPSGCGGEQLRALVAGPGAPGSGILPPPPVLPPPATLLHPQE